ncbi:hypothetical protein [Microbacterium testaceum]|uniref:hypothetical protein n=1 Tax=Microbacterium testaceum TaxID=2033 RepID=UPI001D178702|nr:hypothetical protein [Microbacterium testaceum]MCC4250741.1 hypothetical protein [Microbacterium testaceum]
MAKPLMFVLTAQKRAVRRQGRNEDWKPDAEGFAKRWPAGRRPDIGVQRSIDYSSLAEKAAAMNEAQIRSNFLDWLFVVDVDAPIPA